MSLIQNAQILCFMKKLHELFPQYPAHDILIKWCEQKQIPLSTFTEKSDLVI